MGYKILAINPGSTSTKIAVYEYDTVVFLKTIRHSAEELSKFEKITDQNYDFIEYAYDTYFIVTNAENKVGMIDIEENIKVEFEYDLIQVIKGKSIIQAIDFSNNKTDIFDNEFDLALEMTNASIDILDEGIRVYNNEIEHFLDDNGKFVTK